MTLVRRRYRSAIRISMAGFFAASAGFEPCVQGDAVASAVAFPPASDTVIRVARSTDGLTFADTGEVFLQHAAAPSLVVLPRGQLLAMFDYAGTDGSRDPTVISVSRSPDAGRSWLPVRHVRLNGDRGRSLRARHGHLVRERNGRFRLFFVADAKHGKTMLRRRSNAAAVIRSAVTLNGLDYYFDRRTRIRLFGLADTHPIVARLGTRYHLFAADGRGAGADAEGDAARAWHFVSRDGRRFARLRSSRTPHVNFVGSIVFVGGVLRAYVSSDSGIRSLVSRDGRDWAPESGVRLAEGWDPAVTRLNDGTYLMLYCVAARQEPLTSSQLVEDSFDGKGADEQYADTHETAGSAGRQAQREFIGQPLEPAKSEAFFEPDADGFAPRPDFRKRVDYLEWYRRYALGQPEDNAYEHYMSFMPGLHDEPGSKPEWPGQFNDMFSADHTAPPAPWDPADHPDWEETNRAIQGLLEQFREASRHTGYASPGELTSDGGVAWPDGKDLLIGLLLPSLAPHRQMVKSTLADAWRIENGRVSPDRMLEAWRTSLRGASHVFGGATLIENLVGTAETAQVQSHARWALKHDVFAEDELQTAFETLREYDREHWDPAVALRGEHAMAMQMTQWMFSPPTPDGQPKLNIKRAEALSKEDWFGDDVENVVNRFAEMGPEDAYASVEAFDDYYRELADQMSVGYPDVRTEDIDATTERFLHTTPLTEVLTPSLGRVYKLKARLETSRRATQLAYAAHLFKAENGRWPESLEELPAEYGEEMRIDPFSGDYFGYRVTADGPTIYSVSENGVDDAGVHARRWDDKPDPETGSDDHVFWPPQPRR